MEKVLGESESGEEYVLYIAAMRGKIELLCKGSSICLHLIEENNIPCVIQDMDVLRKNNVSFPDWLKGSPTLVRLNPKNIFTGIKAIKELERYTNETHYSHSPQYSQHSQHSQHSQQSKSADSDSQLPADHGSEQKDTNETPIGGLEEMMQQRGVAST